MSGEYHSQNAAVRDWEAARSKPTNLVLGRSANHSAQVPPYLKFEGLTISGLTFIIHAMCMTILSYYDGRRALCWGSGQAFLGIIAWCCGWRQVNYGQSP